MWKYFGAVAPNKPPLAAHADTDAKGFLLWWVVWIGGGVLLNGVSAAFRTLTVEPFHSFPDEPIHSPVTEVRPSVLLTSIQGSRHFAEPGRHKRGSAPFQSSHHSPSDDCHAERFGDFVVRNLLRLMRYRAETTSLEGFVQQIACCYLRHGYWFYVTGHIPANKDASLIDQRLTEKYGIAVSDSTRARRKRLGQAKMQYLRFGRTFVLLATKGQHMFFETELKSIHDIRHTPLKIGGYSISYRRGGRTQDGAKDHSWHAHVEIERRRYLELKAWLLELAMHRSPEYLARAFYQIPFEPYAPVRRQLLNIHRAVNHSRKQAGFSRIPIEVIPLRRRIVRPFDPLPSRLLLNRNASLDS